MTVDRGDARLPRDRDGRAPATAPPEAGHLDQDPEALEDPVHRGDAQHQEQLHDDTDDTDRTD